MSEILYKKANFFRLAAFTPLVLGEDYRHLELAIAVDEFAQFDDFLVCLERLEFLGLLHFGALLRIFEALIQRGRHIMPSVLF